MLLNAEIGNGLAPDGRGRWAVDAVLEWRGGADRREALVRGCGFDPTTGMVVVGAQSCDENAVISTVGGCFTGTQPLEHRVQRKTLVSTNRSVLVYDARAAEVAEVEDGEPPSARGVALSVLRAGDRFPAPE